MKNRIYAVIVLMLMCAESQAMKVCTKSETDCTIYGEVNKDAGAESKFEIYAYSKLVASLILEWNQDWTVLKDGDSYYLLVQSWYMPRLDKYIYQFIYELDNVCENCTPILVSGRYMDSIEGFLEDGGKASFLSGVEKPFSRKYSLDAEEIGSAIEQPSLDSLRVQERIHKYEDRTNMFYMEVFSAESVHLGYKVLYLPPLKKESTPYLYVGCAENCEFKDTLLQQDGITYELVGDIKGIIPVKMELIKTASKLSGKYCYLKTCKEYLSLSGTIKDGLILMEEREKNKVTGTMKLTLKGNSVLIGGWVSSSGKEMPLLLVRVE